MANFYKPEGEPWTPKRFLFGDGRSDFCITLHPGMDITAQQLCGPPEDALRFLQELLQEVEIPMMMQGVQTMRDYDWGD